MILNINIDHRARSRSCTALSYKEPLASAPVAVNTGLAHKVQPSAFKASAVQAIRTTDFPYAPQNRKRRGMQVLRRLLPEL